MTGDFAFESTLGKIARVLMGQYGVVVVFSPHGPRVEPGRIVIPEYQVTDDASKDLLVGYLDLLVARSKYCDVAELDHVTSAVERQLAQVIDDRRACMQLIERYPGARAFIARLRQHSADEAARRWNELAWRDKLVWLIERTLWNERPRRTELSPSLDAALRASDDAIAQARAARSTRDSVSAALKLIAGVRALAAGNVSNMMFSAGPLDTFDAQSISSEFEDLGGDGDGNAPSSFDSRQGASSQAVGMGQSPSNALPAASDGVQVSAPGAPDSGRPLLSIPLTTEFDVVTDLTGRGDRAAWRNLRALARSETAPLKAKLERALKADEQTHWRREQERGEIDRPALAKLATSPGYRTPFRVKRISKGRDAAVTLLIDRSGSMAGKKIELARLCAAALCDALTQLSFDCEVLGYGSIESADMRLLYEEQLALGVDLHRYNRFVERLDLMVYKRFGSSDLSGLAMIECGHENPDGEALAWAAERLGNRHAERRILMVLSDGYPATGDGNPWVLRTDLRARIEAIEGAGIETIGVGVLDDAVETFYRNHIVVRHLHELPEVAFRVLGTALLGRSCS
ncbi:cobaltochelatase CobT-related protein [Caballeronia choica]|nr:cobalamin biosynthesis protein CobT [Caballeronia choica]